MTRSINQLLSDQMLSFSCEGIYIPVYIEWYQRQLLETSLCSLNNFLVPDLTCVLLPAFHFQQQKIKQRSLHFDRRWRQHATESYGSASYKQHMISHNLTLFASCLNKNFSGWCKPNFPVGFCVKTSRVTLAPSGESSGLQKITFNQTCVFWRQDQEQVVTLIRLHSHDRVVYTTFPLTSPK